MTMPAHPKSRSSAAPDAVASVRPAHPVQARGSARRLRITLAVAASTVAATALTGVGALVNGASASEVVPSPRAFHALAQCESNGDYASNTGNGYYGAYQFGLSTWQALGLAGYPDQAPAAVQDGAALSLWKQSGWAPWPGCSAQLGLGAYSLASEGASTPTPPPGRASGSSYKVRRGDSLSAIAHRLGTATDTLVTLNHLENPDLLQVGQVLRV